MSKYTLAIQCTDKLSGKQGCFLYDEKHPFEAITPVFNNLPECFTWMKENGYRPINRNINTQYTK